MLRRGGKEEAAGAFDLGRGRRQSVRPLSYNGGTVPWVRARVRHPCVEVEKERAMERKGERASERASEKAERREKERAGRAKDRAKRERNRMTEVAEGRRERKDEKKRDRESGYPGVDGGTKGGKEHEGSVPRFIVLLRSL